MFRALLPENMAGWPDYANKLGQTVISAVKKTKKTKDKCKGKQ